MVTKFGYMCGVSFEQHLEETIEVIYPNIESLKESETCWKKCGIVKVKIQLEEWVELQDLRKEC